jgi:hypothetical protein
MLSSFTCIDLRDSAIEILYSCDSDCWLMAWRRDETLVTIASRRSADDKERVAVDSGYIARFDLLVFLVILYDAKRIDPDLEA